MIGLHVKKSDDMLKNIKNLHKLYNISCVQFFGLYQNKKLYSEISNYCNENKILMFIHASYSINIAQPILYGIKDWWISTLIRELVIAEKHNCKAVVLHVGKLLQLTKNEGIKNMYLTLELVYEQIKDLNIKLLIETPAGQGTELLSDINDYLNFYKKMPNIMKTKIGLCLDTCHMFSSGIDLRSEKNVISIFKLINDVVGIDKIYVIHLNDSETEFNSHIDRHAPIGKGSIGIIGLTEIIKIAKKYSLPLILETNEQYFAKQYKLISNIIN